MKNAFSLHLNGHLTNLVGWWRRVEKSERGTELPGRRKEIKRSRSKAIISEEVLPWSRNHYRQTSEDSLTRDRTTNHM